MNRSVVFVGIVAVQIGLAPAAEAKKPYSLELTAGAEYDSHLTVEELDIESSVGDIAAIFRLDADYKPVRSRAGELRVGYSFDQSLYAERDEFDTQTHRLSAGGSARIGRARLATDYSFYHIRLGGDPLLNMHVISPSLSGFVGDKLFARAYYSYFDKDFQRFENRDANTHQAGFTVNRYFNRSRSFVSIGARYDNEDAVDPALDYEGLLLTANLQLPLELAARRGKVNFGYSYRDRDYDNVTPSIGERRRENRSVFRVRSELPIVNKLSLQADYGYTDRNSNFPSADYNEHKALAALKLEL